VSVVLLVHPKLNHPMYLFSPLFLTFALGTAATPQLTAIAPAAPVVGAYEAARVNRKTLPMADRVQASPGYEHAVKLEEMILRLRNDGRFVATVRYHHSMVKAKARAEDTPILTESVRGKYEVKGNSIRFLPDPDAKGRRVKPVTGTLTGQRITVPIDYRSGTLTRRFVVDLDRNENIW
jgi:hypothetical protein